MSEKRFEWIDKDTISDNQTDEWYCFLFDDIRDDFVDLLNELNDENKTLKKENEWLRKELKGLNKKYIAFSEATDKRLKEMMKEMMR